MFLSSCIFDVSSNGPFHYESIQNSVYYLLNVMMYSSASSQITTCVYNMSKLKSLIS